MSEVFYIYSLCCPDTNEVRYIGQTKNLKSRLTGHLSLQSSKEKDAWITDLKSHNKTPLMKVIETCGLESVDEREAFYIAKYRLLGKLINVRDRKGQPRPPRYTKSGEIKKSILIDLSKEIVLAIDAAAQKEGRTRKTQIEHILIQHHKKNHDK